MKTLIITFLTMMSLSGFAAGDMAWDGKTVPTPSSIQAPYYPGYYFNWGQGRDGWGYCYQWTSSGQVLNQGMPVDKWNCEQTNPSTYNWGRGQNGWGYCYHYTPYGIAMEQGMPTSNYLCEQRSPSYYAWGRGSNGYTYCYQWTPNGLALNEGQPVANSYCGY